MTRSRRSAGGLTLLLAACTVDSSPASVPGVRGADAWDADGAALARLSTPCTLVGSKFTVTLVDGESALIQATSKSVLQVNGDICTSTETRKSAVKSIDVKLADGFAADGRGVRVMLDYSGGALVPSGTTAPVLVTLGGRAHDEVWLRTTTRADYVNVGEDAAVSVGTSATNTKKDVALSKVGSLTLMLGAGADVLSAGAATLPVAVYGGADKDVLATGSANDLLDGGEGDDTLFGGPGDDWMDGGEGDDTLDGQIGCDGYTGGQGTDLVLDDESAARIELVELNFAKGRGDCESSGFGGPSTGDGTPPPGGGSPGTVGALTTKTFRGVPVDFSYIPAGTFRMGSPDSDPEAEMLEKTQHDVTLTTPFLLARTEVTQELWRAVTGKNPSYFVTGEFRLPVERVTWNDAQAFMESLNAVEGVTGKYRLPTEAEWEYAARAGTTDVRYGATYAVAWYPGNSGATTHAVKGKAPNAWMLYDMLGNVWEWTADYWDDSRATGYIPYWTSEPVTDPTGPASGPWRVCRGGSFSSDAWRDDAADARAASRGCGGLTPDVTYKMMGLRAARSLP